jgi:hypothetical protein
MGLKINAVAPIEWLNITETMLTMCRHGVNFLAKLARTYMTGKDGPPVGVGNSFPVWKERAGRGLSLRSKKTFRPDIRISKADPPLASYSTIHDPSSQCLKCSTIVKSPTWCPFSSLHPRCLFFFRWICIRISDFRHKSATLSYAACVFRVSGLIFGTLLPSV